ncbi:NAD(P)H-binding protein [Streptomyces sp. HNA39]|uniref:SDR family oxidoreductase n=2 Tax=Streptomyces TaxID=1883 RepID=UPI0032B1F92B
MTENAKKTSYTKRSEDPRRGVEAMGTVLVTSGTGKTGRRVAERLTEQGVPVRAGSRNASPTGVAAGGRSGGVRFDWADPSGWAVTLDGTEAAYVAYPPDLAMPGTAEAMAEFGRLAAQAGVRRVVLPSGRGEARAVLAEEALRGAAGGVGVSAATTTTATTPPPPTVCGGCWGGRRRTSPRSPVRPPGAAPGTPLCTGPRAAELERSPPARPPAPAGRRVHRRYTPETLLRQKHDRHIAGAGRWP